MLHRVMVHQNDQVWYKQGKWNLSKGLQQPKVKSSPHKLLIGPHDNHRFYHLAIFFKISTDNGFFKDAEVFDYDLLV